VPTRGQAEAAGPGEVGGVEEVLIDLAPHLLWRPGLVFAFSFFSPEFILRSERRRKFVPLNQASP
jgi:hypothetical protein